MATEHRIVLIRSGQSGVWMGEFIERNGDSVQLANARKIWRWRGAKTTSELALHGCEKGYSRVAEPVTVTVSGVCEQIEATAAAWEAVRACGWAEE